MSTRRNSPADSTVSRMKNYTLQLKAAPFDGAAPIDDPAAAEAPALDQEAQPHEWAGDVYTEGDEPDPSTAEAQLAGPDGESAWLMRADDGTLTGWVRDSDETILRYSDVDAWAIDVDQAGMQEGAAAAPAEEDPTGGDMLAPEEDAEAPLDEDPLAEPGAVGDPFADDAPAEEGEPPADAPAEDAPAEEPAAAELDAPLAEPAAPEDGTEPDDGEDELEQMLAGLEKKSWLTSTGVRLTARKVS